MDRDKQV
ncbi:hypothetical protein EC940618_3776, partial [Escherichia coli 94.0618]